MSEATKDEATKPQFTIEQIRAKRKRDCALGYRLLAAQKWGDLGDGHISARDPVRTDCFWMLRYGVSYHAAMVSDLVLVGPDGQLIEGEGFVNIAGLLYSSTYFGSAARSGQRRSCAHGMGYSFLCRSAANRTDYARVPASSLKIMRYGMTKKYKCKVSLPVAGSQRR